MTTPTPCPILNLNLGPLDLNLLGLHVHLNEVILNIEAIPGPGNLLCAVARLLDGVDLGSVLGNLLQQLINAIIRLLQGLGRGRHPGTRAAAVMTTPTDPAQPDRGAQIEAATADLEDLQDLLRRAARSS